MWDSYWHRRWPNPDVLSRFAGYEPPCTPVDIMTLPSGYTQLNNGQYAPSPLLAAQDPSVGAFIRGTAIYAGWDLHSEYITTDTATAAIGTFAIGESPLGYIRAYHGTLTFSTGGFGGIGEFQIGIDAIGVGGSYPVLTDTPWPYVPGSGTQIATVDGGIETPGAPWGGFALPAGRPAAIIVPTNLPTAGWAAAGEYAASAGAFFENPYNGPWLLSSPTGLAIASLEVGFYGVITEANWGTYSFARPRGS